MASGGEMTTAQFLIFVGPFLGTILLIFAMKYISAALQARARFANDEMYRGIAEKSLAVQTESEAALSAMRAELSKIAGSVAAVEKMLSQVD